MYVVNLKVGCHSLLRTLGLLGGRAVGHQGRIPLSKMEGTGIKMGVICMVATIN